MTEDRRRHPRFPSGTDGGEDLPGEGGRAREPAETHFRRMHDRRARPVQPPQIESES